MSSTLVLCIRPPDVPVMSSWYCPGFTRGANSALGAGAGGTYSVNVLASAVLAGVNDVFTPSGAPVTDNCTSPRKPCCRLTMIVLVPLFPCATVISAGDAKRA